MTESEASQVEYLMVARTLQRLLFRIHWLMLHCLGSKLYMTSVAHEEDLFVEEVLQGVRESGKATGRGQESSQTPSSLISQQLEDDELCHVMCGGGRPRRVDSGFHRGSVCLLVTIWRILSRQRQQRDVWLNGGGRAKRSSLCERALATSVDLEVVTSENTTAFAPLSSDLEGDFVAEMR